MWRTPTRFRGLLDTPRKALASAFVLLLLTACGERNETLTPERRLEGSLSGGESVSIDVPLEANRYVDLIVDQRGIDVVVSLEDPEGEKVVEADGLLGAWGPERILWVTSTPGTYRLEIRSLSAVSPEGDYAAWVQELRLPTELDRRRVAAAITFQEADWLEYAGDLEHAATKYDEAIAEFTDLGDEYWQAITHYSLGYHQLHLVGSASSSGDANRALTPQSYEPEKSLLFYDATAALHHYQESLKLAGMVSGLRAGALYNIGDIYFDLYDFETARENHAAALPIWRRLGNRFKEAATLNNLGHDLKLMAELQEALAHYNQAIEIWRELGTIEEEANTLHNRARCYAALGRPREAIDELYGALELWERLDNGPRTAFTLTALGGLLQKEGNLEEASAHLNRALELRRNDPLGRAITRVELGEVYLQQGDVETARRVFTETLKVFRDSGYKHGEAVALFRLGKLREEDDPEQASVVYREAQGISMELGNRDMEAAVLLALARTDRQRGDLASALEHVEDALGLIEALRKGPDGFDLSSVYFASKQDYYDFYIDLLMELHKEDPGAAYDAKALTASERSRARSLLDTLRESGVDLRRDGDGNSVERVQELERLLEAKYYQREALLRAGNADQHLLASVQSELDGLILELDRARGELLRSNSLYAGLTWPQPLRAEEIQSGVLDRETLLLEFQLAEPRSYLWAVTTETIATFELPGKNEIESCARWVHDILTESPQKLTLNRGKLTFALQTMSELLLTSAARDLERNKRLLIVTEGALQYIPFGALPQPSPHADEHSKPLAVEHEIVYIPSASILAMLRRQSAGFRETPLRMAIFADPVYSEDPRMPTSGARSSENLNGDSALNLGRLFFSRQEAEYIHATASKNGYSDLLAVGFDATRERVLGSQLDGYRYLHFATHSFVDTELPELSSLVLSLFDESGREIEGSLFVHQIYQLDLRAELVVLSACRTASGKDIRGEGLVGWTHGFMYSGAKRVLVSLWDVDDEATAQLMRRFYEYMIGQGLTPATALWKAQASIRADPRWRAPYYWAGFVLQGEYM